jgi:hypothetical protein
VVQFAKNDSYQDMAFSHIATVQKIGRALSPCSLLKPYLPNSAPKGGLYEDVYAAGLKALP